MYVNWPDNLNINRNFSRPVKTVRFQQGKRKIQSKHKQHSIILILYISTDRMYLIVFFKKFCKKSFVLGFCSSSVHRSIASPSIGCFCLPFSTNNRCFVRRPHLLKEGLFFDSSCPQISQETNCCNFWRKKHVKRINNVIRSIFPVFHELFDYKWIRFLQ